MSKAAQLAAYQAGLKTALIEFTDGDDAITIADAGVVTLLNTAVAKSEGGTVTTNIAQGLAKSWLNIRGTSTVLIRDSLNTSSVTDNGTGNYTQNINNDFSAEAYSALCQGNVNGSNTDIRRNTRLVSTTVGAVNVATGNYPDSKEDYDQVYFAEFGDLV